MTQRAPDRLLRTAIGSRELGGSPRLMGVVNATPDSFSDGGRHRTLAERMDLARAMVEAGAELIDVGGESGLTGVPPVSPEEEIERVVPLIELLRQEVDVLLSVDTYKPAVARAA